MKLSVGAAGLARFFIVLGRREHQCPALLRPRSIPSPIRDLSRITADGARARAGGQTAGAGAAVAVIEEDGQACAAVEDGVEELAQLLVADIENAKP